MANWRRDLRMKLQSVGWGLRGMCVLVSMSLSLVVVVGSVGSQEEVVERGVKVWRKNTNFGNAKNWEGLVDENCSGNIFSFPGWMDPSVVAFPSTFIGKQIILPVNGHFVFQPGLTTLSDSGTCQHGREMKFRRTEKADWFDPQNWNIIDRVNSGVNNAVPHVERVPCQFDSVKFPPRTTFNLKITQKVEIGKFYLGDEEKTYIDVAVMMTSTLGKLQFEKTSEVLFNLTKLTCTDDDQCICDNYKPNIRQKICSLSRCGSVHEECHNPILPHGFCSCPICGFHIKIRHTGAIKLKPVIAKLFVASISLADSSSRPKSLFEYHVGRYEPKRAHIIIVPGKNSTSTSFRVLGEIVAYLKSQPQVEEVAWNGSWEDVPQDVDKWANEGLGGGLITFIVILISLVVAILCFIFYRNKTAYPPLTLPNIPDWLSGLTMPNIRVPSMQMPTINIPLPGRRGDTQAGGRTFGFARFSNERVSTVNIERSAGALERGEQVDETINPIDSSEIVTDATPGIGFANVTYDIIGVTDGPQTSEQSQGMYPLGIVDFSDTTPLSQAQSGVTAPATSGMEETSQTGSTVRPPKPVRTNVEQSEEPIYDQVFDAIDDKGTSEILVAGLPGGKEE